VVIAIYLGLLYVLSIAFPESGFRLETREQILSLLVNAVMFFFVFTLVYALVDRSRRRRLGETTQSSKSGKPTGEAEGPSGPLKGRPNPNTSRKKARRKR
jgi:4-hydroxybenzoate polyprenyltransferase